MLANILAQSAELVNTVERLGLPIVALGGIALFFVRYLWPFMTERQDKIQEEIKSLIAGFSEAQQKLTDEHKAEMRSMIEDYRSLSDRQMEQNKQLLHAVGAITGALNGVSDAVSRMGDVQNIKEQLHELEKRQQPK